MKGLLGKEEMRMDNIWGRIILVVLALGFTVLVQVRMSKLRSSYFGLFIPVLLFLVTMCILVTDLQHIKEGTAQDSLTGITAFLYFALYNIPTILFLCIYNYYQRMRFQASKRKK